MELSRDGKAGRASDGWVRGKLFTYLRSLYILMTPGHAPKGSREKGFLSDYQKRNLLFRIFGAPTPNTLYEEVPHG